MEVPEVIISVKIYSMIIINFLNLLGKDMRESLRNVRKEREMMSLVITETGRK